MKTAATALSAIALLGLTLVGSGTPVQAQGLFETLFGGGIKKARRDDFPAPPPATRRIQPKQAPKIAKISAPQYQAYKPDRLVKVNFAPILEAVVPAAYTAGAPSFDESLSGLEGFELDAEAEIARVIVDHYAGTRAFIWVDGGRPNGRAIAAIRVLAEAAGQGLDPADYHVDIPAPDAVDRSATMIRFEMALSARVLRYVRDAETGVVEPDRLSGYYDVPRRPLDLGGVLTTLAGTADAQAYLESRRPQNPQYDALRVELEALRASADDAVTIDSGLLLKPGESSPELPKLLGVIAGGLDDEMGGAFGETLWRLRASEIYEPDLVPVVKEVQKRAGLGTDGIIGPRSVAAIVGVSKADRIAKVRLALEALRWLPSDLGSPRVFINQPAFTASYVEDGRAPLTMRVVVGAPATQTSVFYDEIEQVDYNPYWGVPQSIIVNEMLPRLRRDPGYLDRAGYEVTDAKGRRVPSSSVAWGQFGSKVPYNVRQAPSEANALGELKILFPNKHAIYMHDTPSKSFFERDARALSHGCIRLHDPRGMAAAVLGTSVEHVAGKIARGHSSEKVTRKIPVYVAYFTAWPDDSGRVDYFEDVYGRDARVLQALDATAAARGAGV